MTNNENEPADGRGGKRKGAGRKPMNFLEMYCQGFLAAKMQGNDPLWTGLVRRYQTYPSPMIVIMGMGLLYNVRTMRGVAKVMQVRIWDDEALTWRWEPIDWQRVQVFMRKAGYKRSGYYVKHEVPTVPLPADDDYDRVADLFVDFPDELKGIQASFSPLPTDLLDWTKKESK